jgi:hypothetical protein
MIPTPLYQLDVTVSETLTSTGSDESFTVPAQAAPSLTISPVNDHLSMWLLTVVGDPVYINFNSAATSSNGILGGNQTFGPMIIGPGTVVHGLTTKSSSTITIVRARLV